MSDPNAPNDAKDILSEFEGGPGPASGDSCADPGCCGTGEHKPEPASGDSCADPGCCGTGEHKPEPASGDSCCDAPDNAQAEPASGDSCADPGCGTPHDARPEPRAQAGPAGGSQDADHDVIFVGTKPLMTYVSASMTQLASRPTITIKARGKRITQAVDVSQMLVNRMDSAGYSVGDVRTSSDLLTSEDGRQRHVSTIEIDISRSQPN